MQNAVAFCFSIERGDRRFFSSSTRRRGCALTLNSAHERRMVEVIIGAHAAYVGRFVELVKPRPTISFASPRLFCLPLPPVRSITKFFSHTRTPIASSTFLGFRSKGRLTGESLRENWRINVTAFIRIVSLYTSHVHICVA